MYNKTIFTLLLFLAPIAFIEQTKYDGSSQVNSNKYVKIGDDNYHLIDALFEGNQENSIEIKSCWEEGDLLSQKRYCSSNEKYFHIP